MGIEDFSSPAPALPFPAPGLGGLVPSPPRPPAPPHIPEFLPLHTCISKEENLYFAHKDLILQGVFRFLRALQNLGAFQEHQERKDLSAVTKSSPLVLLWSSWEINFHVLRPCS